MTGTELITGGWFASAVIGKVVDLGRSYLGDNYDLHTGTGKMLRNLENQLPHIQSVIDAAEKRQITNKGLDTWLKQLKDAAYEAEDILDDFEAKRVRKSIKGKGKVSEIASSSVKMVRTLIFSDKDLKKLENVVDKLDNVCMGMGDFIKTLELIHSDKGKKHLDNLGSETSSNLAPGEVIFGRDGPDGEINLILDMILNLNKKYGDFYHRALDDPNVQQREGEGSSSNNVWGLHAILRVVQGLFTPSRAAIPRRREQQVFKYNPETNLKTDDAPKHFEYTPQTNLKKDDVPKRLEYTKRSNLKMDDASEYFEYTPQTNLKKDDAAKQWMRREKQLYEHTSGTIVQKGNVSEQSENRLTTITTISNQQLAVIPIVGVGGVGKTAVAKNIYNNERVKEHFALKAWVYVSENCDATKIIQDILCSFDDRNIINPLMMNLENVGNKLKETITNQRFLLILDDLRDMKDLKWRDLRSVLCYGEVGSVVIVTTQSKIIANTIRTLPEVTLDVLQPESFWELFHYYAFGGFKLGDLKDQPPSLRSKQEELELIGIKIAEKLHGLPLAGKVIGTLLSNKLEREFWDDICGNHWWNIEGARENILPSIGVGYNYLDPQLKQCFVFCSIFPKHYVFERERLVQMWISQGFIQPGKEEIGRLDKGEIRLEDIARKWFGKLVDRSFFQPTLIDGKYLMHDLVRDLAKAVSSNEFSFVKLKSHYNHLPSLARHIGIDCHNSQVEWKCKNSTRLRTMILFGNWRNCSIKSISNIFTKYNGLRVLDLSYIVLEKNAPIDAVCQLSHLRFVDLSFTGIKSIPDEFCALCHLQVLDVRGCNFEKLPEKMNQLINLRHLYASPDTISLISSIGKLTKLQELEEFRIGKSKGHGISELMDMNEISGHLLLSNLNNVSSKEEAAKSQLEKKKYLKSLELRFDEFNSRGPIRSGDIRKVDMEVLDALKPTHSLEILKVGGYQWESFPGWVFSPHHGFYNLKVIHVYSCYRLSSLPAFGELPSLEHLSFDDLPFIHKVGSEFYGSSDVVLPSLKELTFSRMSDIHWLDAEAGKTIFPHLRKLHLEKCGSLWHLPKKSLTSSPVVELILSECYNSNINVIETLLEMMPSLTSLSITNCMINFYIDCTLLNSLKVVHLEDNTNSCKLIFVGGLKYLVNLRKLVIIGFRKILQTYEERPNDEISQKEIDKQCLQFLTYLHLSCKFSCYFPRVRMLSSLRTLLIEDYPEITYTKDEESWFNQLTFLEKLEFRNCRRLIYLPSTLHLLTSLKKLHIYYCPELCSLPENGLPQNLAELYIDNCKYLIPRCQLNEGDEWHKISHIPFVHLKE